jgi:hypothetical protein
LYSCRLLSTKIFVLIIRYNFFSGSLPISNKPYF